MLNCRSHARDEIYLSQSNHMRWTKFVFVKATRCPGLNSSMCEQPYTKIALRQGTVSRPLELEELG